MRDNYNKSNFLLFLALLVLACSPFSAFAQKKKKDELKKSTAAEKKSPESIDPGFEHAFSPQALIKMAQERTIAGQPHFTEPIVVALSKVAYKNILATKYMMVVFDNQTGVRSVVVKDEKGLPVAYAINTLEGAEILANQKGADRLKAYLIPTPKMLIESGNPSKNLYVLSAKEIFGLVEQQNINILPGTSAPEKPGTPSPEATRLEPLPGAN